MPKKQGDNHWGLAASGKSGQWSIDIDEPMDGAAAWMMDIEAPSVNLRISIPGPEIVSRAVNFISDTTSAHEADSLEFGRLGSMPVQLRKDNEFGDRYFLAVVDDASTGTFFVTIGGDDLANLTTVLRQAAEELGN